MILKKRILEALSEKALTHKELKQKIPDKTIRIISATVSQNKNLFVRLDKGYVGLKGRDEHLVTGNRIVPDKFCLYKKLVNLMAHREVRLEYLYERLPDEKKVSIRAYINARPDLFIRVARGVYGRKDRDEWLIRKYALGKESTKIRKTHRETIVEKITKVLLDGERNLQEIHHAMPTYPRKSITSKLSLNQKFEKIGKGVWGLK
ncbi:hypothetical protein BVX95_00930 [archaeon D22]|nr:hypothetical protein BVX95_00930 [archaeon D22]